MIKLVNVEKAFDKNQIIKFIIKTIREIKIAWNIHNLIKTVLKKPIANIT